MADGAGAPAPCAVVELDDGSSEAASSSGPPKCARQREAAAAGHRGSGAAGDRQAAMRAWLGSWSRVEDEAGEEDASEAAGQFLAWGDGAAAGGLVEDEELPTDCPVLDLSELDGPPTFVRASASSAVSPADEPRRASADCPVLDLSGDAGEGGAVGSQSPAEEAKSDAAQALAEAKLRATRLAEAKQRALDMADKALEAPPARGSSRQSVEEAVRAGRLCETRWSAPPKVRLSAEAKREAEREKRKALWGAGPDCFVDLENGRDRPTANGWEHAFDASKTRQKFLRLLGGGELADDIRRKEVEVVSDASDVSEDRAIDEADLPTDCPVFEFSEGQGDLVAVPNPGCPEGERARCHLHKKPKDGCKLCQRYKEFLAKASQNDGLIDDADLPTDCEVFDFGAVGADGAPGAADEAPAGRPSVDFGKVNHELERQFDRLRDRPSGARRGLGSV